MFFCFHCRPQVSQQATNTSTGLDGDRNSSLFSPAVGVQESTSSSQSQLVCTHRTASFYQNKSGVLPPSFSSSSSSATSCSLSPSQCSERLVALETASTLRENGMEISTELVTPFNQCFKFVDMVHVPCAESRVNSNNDDILLSATHCQTLQCTDQETSLPAWSNIC